MKAYAILQVKSATEDGVISGIATSATPDRVGDIVEPAGAKFALPLPLLWQHDKNDPIGTVTDAQVTDAGIMVRAKIEKDLDARIGRYWTLLKSGLVRGLSIGFRGLQSEPNGRSGIRFKSWEWLELSAVTIPANAEATVLAVKAAASEWTDFERFAWLDFERKRTSPDQVNPYDAMRPAARDRVTYFDR